MGASPSLPQIHLHEFTISSQPLLYQLTDLHSRLGLKFLVDGVERKELLSTYSYIGFGMWEVDGHMNMNSEDRSLTVAVMVHAEGAVKELNNVTISYSQLLQAHAEVRLEDFYNFTLEASSSTVPIVIRCSIRTSPYTRTEQITSESSAKSVADEGTDIVKSVHHRIIGAAGGSNSNQAQVLALNDSLVPNIANLERDYILVGFLDSLEDKARSLNSIGSKYGILYDNTNDMAHLESSISILNEALQTLQNSGTDSARPRYLDDFATSVLKRFQRTRSHNDIELVISTSRSVVEIAEKSGPHRHLYIQHLAVGLLERFKRLGNLEDLQDSISSMKEAKELIADHHPDRPSCLSILGDALEARFNRLGHSEDLEFSGMYKQNAVGLMLNEHPHKPGFLSSLGNDLQARIFSRVEALAVIIVDTEKANDLLPDGHPDKPKLIGDLGIAFKSRYSRLNGVEDLEISINHQENAARLIPDGDPIKPKCLNNLSNALTERFHRLGDISDLEAALVHRRNAIALTPKGHPDHPNYLNSLVNTFEWRFSRLGCAEDLEMVIVFRKNILDLIPEGHPDRARYLRSLGNALERQFDRFGQIGDLETALIHNQKAVELIPDRHPVKPSYLQSLGILLQKRFGLLGDVEDLEIAIKYQQSAADLLPDFHPEKLSHLVTLGKAFIFRYNLTKQQEDARAALLQFSMAASIQMGNPRAQLEAAISWCRTFELLERLEVSNSSSLQPYHVAIDLLPRIAWMGHPMTTQHTLLEEFGGTVREAVSAAIKAKDYRTAVELGEAGRSIAWQHLLNLRTPVSELQKVHKDLAERLESISRHLDMSVRGDNRDIEAPIDDLKKSSLGHTHLAVEWDRIIWEIRSKPGFESFLKPKSFNQLENAAHNGPVIIINVNRNRCDALILTLGDNTGVQVSSIPLTGFSYEKSEALLKNLKALFSFRETRTRDIKESNHVSIDGDNVVSLEQILRTLWVDVAKPVIESLAYQPHSTDLPRIWWCASGPLAFLPIHAAGLYDTDEPGNKLSDYVVSSYTPTLSALLDNSPPAVQDDFTLLTVAQANAPDSLPIPNTEIEVEHIKSLASNIKVTTMTNKDATVENVLHGIEKSNWVHLACHGQQTINEPMKSGLLLHDGILDLMRLIEKPLPRADFAFLSASQTAAGDEKVAEESLHLAAGMLFAGYKGVITTMWSIKDDIAPRVAEDVYRVMLKDGKPNREAAAYALHEAVKRLREDPEVDMLHWVPFIHIGQ